MPRARLFRPVSRACLVFLAAVAACLGAVSAQASTFELDLRPYDGSNLICSPVSLDQRSESVPVEASVTDQVNDVVSNSVGTYEARADRGIVQMRARVSHRVKPGFGRIVGTCSYVRELIDDIVVTGPPGSITAELNANLLGELATDSLSTRSELSVTVSLTALDGGGGVKDTAANTVVLDPEFEGEISQAISSGPVSFQVGDALVAELRIDMRLVTSSVHDVTLINEFDFLDGPSDFGLHFSYENVLSLPPGYTSSSTDADIEGNQWRGTVPAELQSWGKLKGRYR